MAFETGTFTDPANLLSKLNTFLTANGWTSNTGGTGGNPSSSQYSFNDGAGGHFHLVPRNDLGEIHGQPATAYVNSSTNFYAHTGTPSSAGTDGTYPKMGGLPTSGSNTYYFFAPNSAPRYAHVVARFTSGEYAHMAFGTCRKYGSYTGGQYFAAQSWRPTSTASQFMFEDDLNSTWSAQWARCDGAFSLSTPTWTERIGFAFGWSGQSNAHKTFTAPLYAFGLIDLTQRTPLSPNILKVISATPNFIFIGDTPELKLCSMQGRNPDGEQITIGSDTWYVFPARRMGASPSSAADAYNISGAQPNHVTNLAGYAYKRID
jgi:hypothetical protein